jgi:hypothetical protein
MGDKRMPEDLMEIGSPAGMSNCGHTIDPGIEDALRGGKYTHYAGWNFNGIVWFDAGLFHCEVWRYGSYGETVSADTLEGIMESVSDKYGWD